jgi:hypothetical protein
VFESQFWRRYCQTFSTGFSSGGARGEEDWRDVYGHVELAGRVPPSAIEQQHGVGSLSHVARNFVEVKLHHVGVGIGQRQCGPDASRRTDRAEQIGVVVALVGGLPWPRSSPGPLADEPVLLADPRLVLTLRLPPVKT